MDTTMTGDGQHAVPNQLLTVRAQSTGQPPPRIEAWPASGSKIEIEPLDRAPGLLSLPITGATVIRVRPPHSAPAFPPETAVTIAIGPDNPTAERLVLRSVDVSGMAEADLLHLDPIGEQVVVSTLQSDDLVLTPLAHQARIAAREVLATRTVARDHAVTLQVAVDGSASMRLHLNSPAAGRILEVVAGLGCVIAPSSPVLVELAGQSRIRLPERSLDTLAEAAVADASSVPPSIGFRSDVIFDAGDRGLTFLLTDAVPADLQADRADALHLVIIADGGEEVAQPRPDSIGATVLYPAQDWNPSPYELRDLVGRLLSSYRQRHPVVR